MRFACCTGMMAILLTVAGCSPTHSPGDPPASAQRATTELMIQYGCPTCHVIPQVPGAVGKVGPSLAGLAQRSYLAGTLQNTRENLVHWIQHPQQLHPGTAMPEMGVTSADAVRIATFLRSNR
jgi:cytochrome c2